MNEKEIRRIRNFNDPLSDYTTPKPLILNYAKEIKEKQPITVNTIKNRSKENTYNINKSEKNKIIHNNKYQRMKKDYIKKINSARFK